MADLRIADAPEIDESEVQGGLKLPTGGFGNKAINMNTVASWVVKDKDLPSKGYVDDKFNQGNQGLSGHVANKNNPHEVTKEQIGLGNVDNTADVDKPVSNAASAALNLKADKTQLQGLATTTQLDAKADKSTTYTKTEVDGVIDDLYQSLEDNFVANGAALPYDPQVTYNDGAIVVDNGVLKKVEGGTLVNAVDAESVSVGDSTLDVLDQAIKQSWLDRLNVRDFGATLDGERHDLSEKFTTLSAAQVVYPFATSLSDTLDYCALQAAINYASKKGFNSRPTVNNKTGRGSIVYLPSSQAVINKPLIMSRSGNFDGASVYIEGETTSSSVILGSTDFPSGRALIEWEDVPQRVHWQGFKNLVFKLPNVEDTKALWFKKTTACIEGGSTSALIFAEYIHGLTMQNITVEGTNTHHNNLIQFDGYVRVSKFDTMISNVGQGSTPTKNTIFLQFASDYGTSATVLGESNGCAYSEINNIWGMGQRGGNGVLVKGRFLQSTGRNWTNGNGTLDTTPAFEINNSFIFNLENTGSEGRGEQPQYLINNCLGVNLRNIGLGAPDVDGCIGIKFQKCESCTLVGRYAPPASPSFSSRGGKAVIIDADCVNVKVSEFYINSTYLNELQILAPASANNSISWILASNKTQGTYLAGDKKYTKDVVLAVRNATQVIPFGGAFTTIVWQNVQLDTNSKFNSATGEYAAGKITTVRLSGGFTILNAVLGQVYEVSVSLNGAKGDRLALFTSDANGAVFVPFSKIVQVSATQMLGVGISNPSATTDITISQYGTQSNISIEEIV